MDSIKKEFIFAEYHEMSTHFGAFLSKRLTTLGVGITVTGYLIKEGLQAKPEIKFVYDALLMLSMFVLIKILVSLTRHIYIFTLRMKELAAEMDQVDFWKIWHKYLQKNHSDSATYMYVIIMHALNIATCAYIVITDLQIMYAKGTTVQIRYATGLYWSTILISILLFIRFFFFIKTKLPAKGLGKEIEPKWEEAKSALRKNNSDVIPVSEIQSIQKKTI